MLRKWHKTALVVVAVLVLIPALATLLGLVIKALWNWLMPAIFTLPQITFWQALGLFVLLHLLLGSGSLKAHADRRRRGGNFRARVKEELASEREASA